jgi:sugar phosphate permease
MIPLIVWLTDKFGWRVALVVLGLGIWVLGVPVIAVVRNRPVSTEGVQELGGDGTQSAASGKSPEMSFHEVLRTWIFWYINITDVIRMIAVTAIVTHIMPYLEGMGVPRTTAGVVAAAVFRPALFRESPGRDVGSGFNRRRRRPDAGGLGI